MKQPMVVPLTGFYRLQLKERRNATLMWGAGWAVLYGGAVLLWWLATGQALGLVVGGPFLVASMRKWGQAVAAHQDLTRDTCLLLEGRGVVERTGGYSLRRGMHETAYRIRLEDGTPLRTSHQSLPLYLDWHKRYAFTYAAASKLLLDMREVGQAAVS